MNESERDLVDILVVDDRPENIVALRGLLKDPSYRIISAPSGAEALRHILKHDFAVVLLDVLMPRMDGFETAALIRERAASSHLPIIFLTATGNDINLIYKGYSVGAVDYLIKPLDPDVVRAKVAVFVDLFRKNKTIREQEAKLREAERKQSEIALRESEEQYEATFEEAGSGIAHLTLGGLWQRSNARLSELLGRSRDELLRLHLQDIFYADDLALLTPQLEKLLAGKQKTHQGEGRLYRADGSLVWVHLTVSLLRDHAGTPKRFIAVFEDIGERKRSEQAERFLAVSGDLLLSSLDDRSALAKIAEMACPMLGNVCVFGTLDENRRVVSLESGFAEPEDEPLALALRELFARSPLGQEHPVSLAMETGVLAEGDWDRPAESACKGTFRLLAARDPEQSLVVPLLARSRTLGCLVFLLTSPSRRYDAFDRLLAKELARRVALAVDNARLYQQAQDAIRLRDDFLSIASHELRTPLTPLQIHFQRLLGTKRKDGLESIPIDRLRSVLERCNYQVQRLTALLERLFDVSRMSAGRLEIEPEEVNLAELVTETAEKFAEEAQRAGARVEFDVGEGAIVGHWDRLRVEQVLTNLVTNAIKYGNGSTIRVRLEMAGAFALLIVEDGGIGIAPEKVPYIFNRFERAVASQSYGGLGLGLYIARQIVEAHGGTIEAASELGAGTTFTVRLPLGEVPEDAPTKVASLSVQA